MRGKELLYSAAFSMFLWGCANGAPVQPKSSGSDTESISTAQAVKAKGIDGLIKDGFTEETLKSQHIIDSTWSYNLNHDGKNSLEEIGSSCDSTAYKLEGKNGIFLLTDYHCLAPEHLSHGIEEYIKKSSTYLNFLVTDVSLFSLKINGFTLKRNEFGIGYFKDKTFDFGGPDGLAVIFIPNQILSFYPDLHISLVHYARNIDNFWFTEIPKESKFFEICTPGKTVFLPVVMENGTLDPNEVQTDNTLYVTPLSSGDGCSGAAIVANINNIQVVVATHIGRRNFEGNKTVVGYKLAGIGKENFLKTAGKAIEDSQN